MSESKISRREFVGTASAAALAASIPSIALTSRASGGYGIVINSGRVMDPETMYDAVANVGIKDGRIAAVTKTRSPARRPSTPQAWWWRQASSTPTGTIAGPSATRSLGYDAVPHDGRTRTACSRRRMIPPGTTTDLCSVAQIF